MAFFGLFKKKKKTTPPKRGMQPMASPPTSPPQPPSPPPAVVVNEEPLVMDGMLTLNASKNNYDNNTTSASPPNNNNKASLYTDSPTSPSRSPTRSSPGRPTTTAVALAEFEEKQAAIDLTRSLVKRFIADIWNRGEVDLIPEVCSPSLRFNGNTGFDRVGHEGLARMVNTIREALDDYHCEIHSMVVENNKAFCRLRFTGKHTGNLLGYPPTRKVVAWMGATEFTCQNGRILKVWELGDIKTLEEQLTNIVEMDEV